MTTLHTPFESIRHVYENGQEYWSGRELALLLGYTRYRHFVQALLKARRACINCGYLVAEHFIETSIKDEVNGGRKRKRPEVHLSRFGCYLATMSADSKLDQVVLCKEYFIQSTMEQERRDKQVASVKKAVLLNQQASPFQEARQPNDSSLALGGGGGSAQQKDVAVTLFLETLVLDKVRREQIVEEEEILRIYQAMQAELDERFSS